MLHPPHTEAGARGRQIHFKFLGATCAGVWFKRVEGEGGQAKSMLPPRPRREQFVLKRVRGSFDV